MPEAYLEPSRTSTIKLFCDFHKDAPSYVHVLLDSKYASAYIYIQVSPTEIILHIILSILNIFAVKYLFLQKKNEIK